MSAKELFADTLIAMYNYGLWVLAILSNFTAIQRMYLVWRNLEPDS